MFVVLTCCWLVSIVCLLILMNKKLTRFMSHPILRHERSPVACIIHDVPTSLHRPICSAVAYFQFGCVCLIVYLVCCVDHEQCMHHGYRHQRNLVAVDPVSLDLAWKCAQSCLEASSHVRRCSHGPMRAPQESLHSLGKLPRFSSQSRTRAFLTESYAVYSAKRRQPTKYTKISCVPNFTAMTKKK